MYTPAAGTQHTRVQTYQMYAARLLQAKQDGNAQLAEHYRAKMVTVQPANSSRP